MIQIISGYILASNYIASTSDSFNIIHSVIMRELDTGWLIRFNHVNGCGLLFIVVYMHMYRSIYYNSISKTSVWIIGVIMYIILCGIAFTGYSLVYGQMSLWAIVVICSLVTAIPLIGNKLLILIWGGSVVSSVTLQRIFCVHYLLPLLIILLILIHLYNLHYINSTGDMYFINNRYDRINFYPLLLIRDIFIGSLILIIFNVFVYFYSDIFVHSDNYIPANPLVTPSEIMPEFYLLPFYALIRAIPNKVLGIVIMVLFLLSLSNIYPIFIIRYYNNISILHRSILLLLVLDLFIASKLCLFINHYESFYLLLILCVLCILSNNIYYDSNSNNNNINNNSSNMLFTNLNYESIVNYFDQSIILYTSIINAIIVGMIFIIYSWYNRQGVCNMYIYNILIEVIWTILPIVFICIMLLHSIRTIYISEINRVSSSSYVNVIGNQWYWIYNSIESRISSIGRIIYVDQPLFIHSNTCTSLIISSLDVIHSFSLPVLGIKVDAIPGRINCVNITSIVNGLYIGYCSELCGSGHGFMPINMVVY